MSSGLRSGLRRYLLGSVAPEDMRFALMMRAAGILPSSICWLRTIAKHSAFLQLHAALAGGALSGGAAIALSAATTLPKAPRLRTFRLCRPFGPRCDVLHGSICRVIINSTFGRKPDFWMRANEVTADGI